MNTFLLFVIGYLFIGVLFTVGISPMLKEVEEDEKSKGLFSWHIVGYIFTTVFWFPMVFVKLFRAMI